MPFTPAIRALCATVVAIGSVLAQDPHQPDPRARHWAFLPPQSSTPPDLADADARWSQNPIDRFVRHAQVEAGIPGSSEADRLTLLRRVSLALTGLPPTPAEADAFSSDESADAYERVVERLLASRHYGERMAQWWLDLSRFADTDGFHVDGHRDMWKWREWVIDAFTRGKRFDEFTIEQLAGDMLPNPSIAQLVASGFNRNNMTNIEGGADPAEYAVRYVVDRVNTTATVWLGVTMKCAECHDHKYDPFSQKDYYRFFALFNNMAESGLSGYYGNAPPFIPVPTPAEQAGINQTIAKINGRRGALQKLEPELAGAQARWELQLRAERLAPEVREDLLLHFDMDEACGELTDRAGSGARASVRGATEAGWGAGRLGAALELAGADTHLDCGDVADFEHTDAFTVAAWVKFELGGSIVARLADTQAGRGYEFGAVNRTLSLQLGHRWPGNAIRVSAGEKLLGGRWYHVCATYDGSGKAAGVALYVDGKPRAGTVEADDLNGTIRIDQPLRIGRREVEFAYSGALDEVRVYRRALASSEIRRLAMQPVLLALAKPAGERDARDNAELSNYYRDHVSPRARAIRAEIAEITALQARLLAEIPTTMIMAERPQRPETHVLIRGDYRSQGERVEPDVPAILPALPAGQPKNRLALARWLVRADHPLTSRVTVNRLWEQLFGRGLVTTGGDFGLKGSPPSHPELLDWLATEFVQSGWDVRHMIRLIVTSATFRQSAVTTPRQRALDPSNILLGHSRRPRLDAETIRDNALAISGLLDRRIGGPSVRPYQPPGLWKEVAFGGNYPSQVYEQSAGADLYRRGLYVYWKRSSPYASFRIFDAPTRELCTVSRQTTNTPLQALALLNDPVYLEAARALGVRLLLEGGEDDDARIAFGIRLCVTRLPRDGEVAVLRQLLRDERQRLAGDPAAVRALLTLGDYRHPATLEDTEVGAWTLLGSALLNTSEVITRP